MTLSEIYLSLHERRTLRKATRQPIPSSKAAQLLKYGLVEEITTPVPGYMPNPTGQAKITDKGRRYLLYLQSISKREIWRPIIVAVVTSLVTTVITSLLIRWLPLMPG